MKALILDIDDTLFDWLDMWEGAFLAALTEMKRGGSVEESLKAKLRELHVAAGTSERGYNKGDALHLAISAEDAEAAGDAYEREAAKRTTPFPGVVETLSDLASRGIAIVLHTSSPSAVAHHRGLALGLDGIASRIYATETRPPTIIRSGKPKCTKSRVVILEDAKPSPNALLRILADLGLSAAETVYLGDSKKHDIPMARAVGVLDVHAKYGCRRQSSSYELLRQVSHWTDEEIAHEKIAQASEASHTLETFTAIREFFR